jgi:hypothetical protein
MKSLLLNLHLSRSSNLIFSKGCGSGLDPDLMNFNDFVDPDPHWEPGSRIRIKGQENEEN